MGYEGLVSQSESEKKQIFFTVKKIYKKIDFTYFLLMIMLRYLNYILLDGSLLLII